LDDVERMTQYLGQMGREHQSMGVHKQYLDVMGPIFCQTLRPILQVRKSLVSLFKGHPTSKT
jgi:hypothetical protein